MSATATKPKEDSKTPATTEAPLAPREASIISKVRSKIDNAAKNFGLLFPADYAIENALASANLKLLTIEDKDKKRIMTPAGQPTGIVTEASIVNAVYEMCVQGLRVDLRQCYFIVYGDQLVMQPSYFGDIVQAQREFPNYQFYFDVVYQGEEIEYGKFWSKEAGWVDRITTHKKSFPRESNELLGAYCGVINTETGEDLGVILFDMDRIRKSWEKSKTWKFDNSSHKVYPDEQALKTVIRRRCKPLIATSKNLALLESIRRTEMDAVDAEFSEEIAEQANSEPLSLPPVAEGAGEPFPDFSQSKSEKEPAPVASTKKAEPAAQAALVTEEDGPNYD